MVRVVVRRSNTRALLVRAILALLTCQLLAATTRAAGEETAQPAPLAAASLAPHADRALALPTFAFMSAAVSDMTSTYVTNRWGGLREQNPTLNWLQPHPLAMVTLGSAMDVAGVVAWNRFVGRAHPRLAAVGLYAGAAFRTFLAARNFHRATFGAPAVLAPR